MTQTNRVTNPTQASPGHSGNTDLSDNLYEVSVGHVKKNKGFYVGRGKGAKLGNPFPTKSRTKKEHERVVSLYKKHLWKKILEKDPKTLSELMRLKQQLQEKKRITLTCWCREENKKGLPCHADVVAACLLWMIEKDINF